MMKLLNKLLIVSMPIICLLIGCNEDVSKGEQNADTKVKITSCIINCTFPSYDSSRSDGYLTCQEGDQLFIQFGPKTLSEPYITAAGVATLSNGVWNLELNDSTKLLKVCYDKPCNIIYLGHGAQTINSDGSVNIDMYHPIYATSSYEVLSESNLRPFEETTATYSVSPQGLVTIYGYLEPIVSRYRFKVDNNNISYKLLGITHDFMLTADFFLSSDNPSSSELLVVDNLSKEESVGTKYYTRYIYGFFNAWNRLLLYTSDLSIYAKKIEDDMKNGNKSFEVVLPSRSNSGSWLREAHIFDRYDFKEDVSIDTNNVFSALSISTHLDVYGSGDIMYEPADPTRDSYLYVEIDTIPNSSSVRLDIERFNDDGLGRIFFPFPSSEEKKCFIYIKGRNAIIKKGSFVELRNYRKDISFCL